MQSCENEHAVRHASAASLQPLQVLLLEDSRFDAELLAQRLAAHYPRAQLRVVGDEAGFTAALRADAPDLILSDYQLPGFSGAQALELACMLAPDIPFIFVSGVIGEDNAVELLKRGATDYVSKSRLERLPTVLERALRERAERQARDRAERQLRQAEAALRTRHALLEAVLASTVNLVYAKDPEGRYILVNEAAARLIERDMQDIVGRTDAQLFSAELAQALRGNDLQVQHSNQTLSFEEVLDHDGRQLHFYATKTPLRIDGQVVGVVGMSADITALKAAQAALAEAVRAKEALLYEVNHRVKNNLQVISSLLALQARSASAPDAQAAIGEARSRVSVVARLHQQLYQSGRHATLDYARYLKRLAHDTLESLGAAQRVALDVAWEGDPALALNEAVPLSLAVSELLTNAAKYAFPDQGRGRLTLRVLRDAAQLAVLVADDGVGLPPGRASLDKLPTGLGLRIVQALMQQLGARLELPPAARGAAFRIVVPMG